MPHGIFISIEDDIYVSGQSPDHISVWRNGSRSPSISITNNLVKPMSLFVTNSNTVCVNFESSPDRIDRWTLKDKRQETVMTYSYNCAGVFIDIANRLYCASQHGHQIHRRSLEVPKKEPDFIIGTRKSGSSSS